MNNRVRPFFLILLFVISSCETSHTSRKLIINHSGFDCYIDYNNSYLDKINLELTKIEIHNSLIKIHTDSLLIISDRENLNRNLDRLVVSFDKLKLVFKQEIKSIDTRYSNGFAIK